MNLLHEFAWIEDRLRWAKGMDGGCAINLADDLLFEYFGVK